MTEAEWLACNDVEQLLRFAASYTSRRKELLFATACCRRLGHLLTPQCRVILALAEASADARMTVEEREALSNEALAHADDLSWRMGTPEGCARWLAPDAVFDASQRNATGASLGAARAMKCAQEDPATFDIATPGPPCPGDPAERLAQVALLRCIIGNPFRVLPIRRAWHEWGSGPAGPLAQVIYQERSFDRLPILADASCTDAAVLAHCRGPGPHVRGCWVVDLLLGKE